MRRIGVTSGEITAVLTVAAVVVVLLATGEDMFSPGPLSAQTRGSALLGGVASHAEISRCADCHASSWSSQPMADRCLNCHTGVRTQMESSGPLHGRIPGVRECRNCHTEHHGAHAAITSLATFDHDWAAFRLTGKHLAVECQSCHVNNVFQGTARDCVACHAEPKVHLGRFGTRCGQCHSTATWVIAPGNLVDRNFDHDQTGFPLTGMHRSVDCRSCHVQDSFKGTSRACVSCHAEPQVPLVHRNFYGTGCGQCHSTSTWKTVRFNPAIDHWTFSITHHGKNNTCAKCHSDLTHLEVFTCYNCHAHKPLKTEQIHVRRNIVNFETSDCMGCHRRSDARRTSLALPR